MLVGARAKTPLTFTLVALTLFQLWQRRRKWQNNYLSAVAVVVVQVKVIAASSTIRLVCSSGSISSHPLRTEALLPRLRRYPSQSHPSSLLFLVYNSLLFLMLLKWFGERMRRSSSLLASLHMCYLRAAFDVWHVTLANLVSCNTVVLMWSPHHNP